MGDNTQNMKHKTDTNKKDRNGKKQENANKNIKTTDGKQQSNNNK